MQANSHSLFAFEKKLDAHLFKTTLNIPQGAILGKDNTRLKSSYCFLRHASRGGQLVLRHTKPASGSPALLFVKHS